MQLQMKILWITSGIYKLEKGDEDLFSSYGTDTQSSRQMKRIQNLIEWYNNKINIQTKTKYVYNNLEYYI